jgi:hypothetical protein
MDVRLPIVASPASPVRPDARETALPGVSPITQKPQKNTETQKSDSTTVETGNIGNRNALIQPQVQSQMGAAQPSDETSPLSATAPLLSEPIAPPEVQRFQFLVAAQTARDRELQAHQQQLEQRLENLDNRLDIVDSPLSRIDMQLKRARLQQDIERVSSQIRRLRLKYAFESPAGLDQAKIPNQDQKDMHAPEAHPEASRPVHRNVNLIA